jgi:hypothetical protein
VFNFEFDGRQVAQRVVSMLGVVAVLGFDLHPETASVSGPIRLDDLESIGRGYEPLNQARRPQFLRIANSEHPSN